MSMKPIDGFPSDVPPHAVHNIVDGFYLVSSCSVRVPRECRPECIVKSFVDYFGGPYGYSPDNASLKHLSSNMPLDFNEVYVTHRWSRRGLLTEKPVVFNFCKEHNLILAGIQGAVLCAVKGTFPVINQPMISLGLSHTLLSDANHKRVLVPVITHFPQMKVATSEPGVFKLESSERRLQMDTVIDYNGVDFLTFAPKSSSDQLPILLDGQEIVEGICDN